LTQNAHGYIERAHFKDNRCYCETHIPAEQAGAGTPSWLPRSDGDSKWSPGIGTSAREGPQASFGLRKGRPVAAALKRLKTRGEFLAVAATNRRWTTPGLVLQARTVDHDDREAGSQPRIGFTATKKIGNAVARNRARRRLRAVVDEILRGKPGLSSPADLVVVARQAALTRPYVALKDDMRLALERLKLLK
jgi:ribonuclease P protein component